MHDIQIYLDSRKEEPWTYVDKLLLKAQLHILGIKRELDELRKNCE